MSMPRFYYAILGSKKITSANKKIALARIRQLHRDNKLGYDGIGWNKSTPPVQLLLAFRWNDTYEGINFWTKIYKKLRK